MNKDLLKLKKTLLKVNAPTREKQICKALRTIFHDMNEGLTDKEAFEVLGWEYESKSELFSEYDKDKIQVTPHDKFESMVFNENDKEIEAIEGAIIFNEYGLE